MAKEKTRVEDQKRGGEPPVPIQRQPAPEKQGGPDRPALAPDRETAGEPGAGAVRRARATSEMQQGVGNQRVARLAVPKAAASPPAQAPEDAMIQRQRRGSGAAPAAAPRVGTRFSHPTGSSSPYRRMTATFDGREFVLSGDRAVLMRVLAASGRPVSVRPADARMCGGATSESYVNNPRYVGISDYGPIPEGDFRFRAEDLATFTLAEQAQFSLGGHFTDPFGRAMHGGDWGAGRAPLNKVRVRPAPRGCGTTSRRSGFYIHGGLLAGSSGCIDIGNAGIAALLTHIAGYRGQITVTVRYLYPAPAIGVLNRALGGFTYPGQENPSILDRIGGAASQIFGGDDE